MANYYSVTILQVILNIARCLSYIYNGSFDI